LFPDSLNIELGNTIKNYNDLTFSVNGNMTTLYNKVKFLKNIENNTKPDAASRLKPQYKTETWSKEKINFKAKVVKPIYHNLKTRDVTLKVVDSKGVEVKGKVNIISETRVDFTPEEQIDGGTVTITGKVVKKRNPLLVTGEYFVRALMGVRNITFTLTSAEGQILPGYMPQTKYMGMENYNNIMAPGWPFILGFNDRKFFDKAAARGWLTKDTLLNSPATYNTNQTLSLRSLVEPVPGFRIDLNADRRFNKIVSAYFNADANGNFPDSTRNRLVSGNFTISVISWGTAFEKISKNSDYVSPTFEAFKRNTIIISERRANNRMDIDPGYDPDIDPVTNNPIVGPYKSGYGQTSREVLIPAFVAAYTKSNPGKVSLDPFPSALRMMPNWRINFDGLSKFAFVQKVFRSVNISHQYRSTYQISSFTTNLKYGTDASGISYLRDLQKNFVTQYEMNVVSINEQFSPLINIDLNWKSSLTTRIEWKKSRTVSLNLTSNQIADARSDELVVGAGYRFDNVQIVVRSGGGQKTLKSDLNVRVDLSVKDNKTLARKLVENVNQPVVGQKVFRIGASADYILSDRFNLQIFADHEMNNPFVASTFPTSNTNFGFSLKFTLVQ
jgi:cell surface protein SprA